MTRITSQILQNDKKSYGYPKESLKMTRNLKESQRILESDKNHLENPPKSPKKFSKMSGKIQEPKKNPKESSKMTRNLKPKRIPNDP